MSRHAITGVAIANCLGNQSDEVFANAFAGAERFRPASDYFPFPFATEVGLMSLDAAGGRTRLEKVAQASARQLAPAVAAAVARWGARRVGHVFASSTGGLEQSERFLAPHPALPPVAAADYRYADHGIDAASDAIARSLGAAGPRAAVASACSSSLGALARGARLLEHGLCDAVVVGGADTLCRTTIFGFHGLGLLAPTATRPFAAERQGITLGEGSAYVLLERTAASPLAWLAGLGASSDAYHQTSPRPDGAGAEACMRQALARAGLAAPDLCAAHATGTRQNDAVEGAALLRLFGDDLPVTGWKSLFGHTLGASGLSALVLAVEALRRQEIPPTPRAQPLDPALPLAMVHARTPARLGSVLINAFGFGGSNASAVVST